MVTSLRRGYRRDTIQLIIQTPSRRLVILKKSRFNLIDRFTLIVSMNLVHIDRSIFPFSPLPDETCLPFLLIENYKKYIVQFHSITLTPRSPNLTPSLIALVSVVV